MKHLLTAALMVMSLASPIRAEVVEFTCRAIGNDSNMGPLADFELRIDTDTWEADFVRSGTQYITTLVDSGVTYVTWVAKFTNENFPTIVNLVSLNRETLRAQNIIMDDFSFAFTDMGSPPAQVGFQCSDPL